MPRVPSYENFQVAPTVGGAGPISQPTAPGAGAIAGDQLQRAGQALGQAGNVAARIAERELQEQNQTLAIDAVNQAKERLYDLTNGPDGFQAQKGRAALERPDGVDLATEYAGKFQTATADIAAALPNDVARRAFTQQAGALRASLYGQAQGHMLQESVNYRGTVYDGAAANAQREIATNYTDVSKGGAVDQGVVTIESAVRAKARLLGASQEFADVQVRKAVSNAHTLALQSALEKNDVAFASGYLKKYSSQMDADDILRVQGLVTKEMDYQRGTAAAGQAVQAAATTIMPSDSGRLRALVMGAESGGRETNADGSVLTSPKGAKGSMQVMDATNLKPGFGVRPAADDSLAERKRVGEDYLDALLRHYGSTPVALAAYNAGPGNVDAAMKAAKAKDDEANWMSYLPKPSETVPYVTGILAKFQAGEGAPRRATKTEVVAAAVANLGPTASRTAVEAATRIAEHRFETLVSDRKAADDEAGANVMRELVANGGSYETIPAGLRARLPAEDVPKMIDFAKKVARGTDETNDALYLKLTNDGYLRSLGDNEFYKLRSDLSKSDFQHFANERTKLIAGKAGNGPGDLNTQAINETLRSRLSSLKIDPTPKDGSEEAARLGTIQRFVRDSVGAAQAQAGKKFTDVETAQHIDALFARNVQFKSTWFGLFGGQQAPMLSMKPGDIPAEIRTRIESDFKARGLTATDADLLNVYWRMSRGGGSRGSEGKS